MASFRFSKTAIFFSIVLMLAAFQLPALSASNVTVEGGGTYSTLQEALNAAPSGGMVNIALNANTQESGVIQVSSDKTVTIDFKDFTASVNGDLGIRNMGNLTINAGTNGGVSGKVKYGIENWPNASLTINGGSFEGSEYGIKNSGTLDISGGIIRGNHALHGASSNSKITVRGGTFEGTQGYGVYNEKGSADKPITIYGGRFKGSQGSTYNYCIQFAEGVTLDTEPDGEGFYHARKANLAENPGVSIELRVRGEGETAYIPGKSFDVDVVLKSEAGAVFGGFDLNLSYDKNALELVDIKTELGGTLQKNLSLGNVSYVKSGETGTVTSGDETVIATATFRVLSITKDTAAEIGLSSAKVAVVATEAEIEVTKISGFELNIKGANISVNAEHASVVFVSGVSGGNITSGTDVVFTATPELGYSVVSVGYTCGYSNLVELTQSEGKYTIPGTDIDGNITLIVETTAKIYSVTFRAGTGSTMNEAIAYKRYGIDNLYTDQQFTTLFTIPQPVALTGYRLARDEADGEELWESGSGARYTSIGIMSTAIDSDLVLTARTFEQCTVTFTADTGGSISGESTTAVDKGAVLKISDFPGTESGPGFQFDSWLCNEQPVSGDLTIVENLTITAQFRAIDYTVFFPSIEGISFTNVTGVESDKARYGSDIKFTAVFTAPYAADNVSLYYSIGIEQGEVELYSYEGELPIEPDENGVYTIPGESITGAVTIIAAAPDIYTVQFKSGEHGAVSGTTTFSVVAGHVLSIGNLDVVTIEPSPGYGFKEWQIIDAEGETGVAVKPVGFTVQENVTFTAIFEPGQFIISFPNGLIRTTKSPEPTNTDTVICGEDFIFWPVVSGSLVTRVSYSVAEGQPNSLIADSSGCYTIPGDAIIGDIVISVEVVAGDIVFIGKEEYAALENGTKIVELRTEKLEGERYVFTDGRTFYWSGKYNSYVAIVDAAMTQESIAATLRISTGESIEINYDGDINSSGGVSSTDAMIVDSILHDTRLVPTDDMTRFRADVSGDRRVTVTDTTSILRLAVGLDITED